MPKAARTSGVTAITATATVKTPTMARNFPKIIFPSETGAVSTSWSVLLCRSSAMERMVRIGTAINMINEIAESVYDTYGYPARRLYAKKYRPYSARTAAINSHPVIF